MHQNVVATFQAKRGQLILDKRFCFVAGHKQRAFVVAGGRMNTDTTQRVEVHFHHMTCVVLNRRIERGERFYPAAAREAAAFVRAKAHRDAWFQQARQTSAVPVFGQVNQHVILAGFEGFHQSPVKLKLLKKPLFAPVAANGVHLVDMRMAGQHRLGVVIHQRIHFCLRVRFFQHRKAGRGQQYVAVVAQLNDQNALWRAFRRE